jgi:hypothetical protein
MISRSQQAPGVERRQLDGPEHLGEGLVALAARWTFTRLPAGAGEAHWGVERDPRLDQVVEQLGNTVDVAGPEVGTGVVVGEAVLVVGEPTG